MKKNITLFQKNYEEYTYYNVAPFQVYKQAYIDKYFSDLIKEFYDLNKETISGLTAKEVEILRIRYGLYNNNTWQTLETIAKKYGKSPSTISQIISRIDNKINRVFSKSLKTFEFELYNTILIKDMFNAEYIPQSLYNGENTVQEFLDMKMTDIFKKSSYEQRKKMFSYIHSLDLYFTEEKTIPVLEEIYKSKDKAFSDIDIAFLDLSNNSYNSLIKANKYTLKDILDLNKSDLEKIRSLGKSGYTEITGVIHSIGLNFKDEQDIVNQERIHSQQLFNNLQELLRVREKLEKQISSLKEESMLLDNKIAELLQELKEIGDCDARKNK